MEKKESRKKVRTLTMVLILIVLTDMFLAFHDRLTGQTLSPVWKLNDIDLTYGSQRYHAALHATQILQDTHRLYTYYGTHGHYKGKHTGTMWHTQALRDTHRHYGTDDHNMAHTGTIGHTHTLYGTNRHSVAHRGTERYCKAHTGTI